MRVLLVLLIAVSLRAQIYSPTVLREGQPDSTNLPKFAQAIYAQAGATTPRDKAEAIWRFFLTDGRFVKPGFFYHIAGWAYEEPNGEVLDPIKLLNSYGFGLCYHIAPLLAAVYEAGGFADARVWFLTGHTVAEVFYDGAYHYFDSDMMGYNVAGLGPFRGKPVASVRQLERDPDIVLGKMAGPRDARADAVDYPWYPADVREAAMGDLAGLFSSARDNYLFPFTRYSSGHAMDFRLRPGEKLIRFFAPEEPGLYYLPFKFDGKQWSEFPQEVADYQIRTAEGPRSQKDARTWATGRIEYTPTASGDVIDMPSPYVIIDARFSLHVDVAAGGSLLIETSTDGGHQWEPAGELHGPHRGAWSVAPRVIAKSAHGRWTAVSGTYGYKVRITRHAAKVSKLHLVSRIQLNPRTLPALEPGENRLTYSSGEATERVQIPALMLSTAVHGFTLNEETGQRFLIPTPRAVAETVFDLSDEGRTLTGFDAGARFLDLRGGLAPDKLTAETRRTAVTSAAGPASLDWALHREGPYQTLWSYPQELAWRDGDPIDRLLLWPEVFKQIRDLPPGTTRVYVRVRSAGPAIDDVRFAVYAARPPAVGRIRVTHRWSESGKPRERVELIPAGVRERSYTIHAGPNVHNIALTFETAQ